MSLPEIVSQDEWRAARETLLADEKALTRARDELSAKRRSLPMVRVDKDHRFVSEDGREVGLAELFDGRDQLIVVHFMFHPEWDEGCASCTAGAVEIAPGQLEHLHARDTSLVLVSRAPVEKLRAWKAQQGIVAPWYSAGDGDFQYDFGATIDESRGAGEYNFRGREGFAAAGLPTWFDDAPQPFDQPGTSCFLRVGDEVFHTYSSYARGAEWTGGSYAYLDLTALGRQEDWEQPAGRSASLRGNTPDFSS